MGNENFEDGRGSSEFAENEQGENSIVHLEYIDGDVLERDEVFSHKMRIIRALKEDNVDEFLWALTKGIEGEKTMKEMGYAFSPYLLLWWTIEHRAVKCAQALLSGKTGLTLDLNAPLFVSSRMGFFPLHIVALRFLPDFVKLFLSAGAIADLQCDRPKSPWTPIQLLLRRLRKKIIWTPKLPVHVLILKLCTLTMDVPLIAVMWLMDYSPIEVTWDIICKYAKEGDAIELAVLLYVDSAYGLGKIASFSFDEYKALRLAIAEKIIMLSGDENYQLAQLGNWKFLERMVKKQEMISVLELLEVFRRTSFQGLGGCATSENIVRRLLGAGFELNDEYLHILQEKPAHERNSLPDMHSSLGLEKTVDHLPSFFQPQALYNNMVQIMIDASDD